MNLIKCSIIVFIAGFIAGAAICYGQPPVSWTVLSSIEPGHKVRVETSDGNHVGTFVDASDDAIRIDGHDGQLGISRLDVLRVYSESGSHRVRNTLIGIAIGAAVGVTMYSTVGVPLRNEGAENTGAKLLMPPIGIGAGIGALLPAKSMKKIYDVKEDISRP